MNSRREPSSTDGFAAPPRSLEDPGLYFNREVSWIEFNERVLAEALDDRHPLLERLKFLAIYATNLDEYFMVRVAALKQAVEAEIIARTDDGRLPAEQLQTISTRLRPSLERHNACLRDRVLPGLEAYGLRILAFDELDPATKARMREVFIERVFPVLTPLAVDRSHPFPYISNLSLSLAVEVAGQNGEATRRSFARVKVPNSLARFVPLDTGDGESRRFLMLEDFIACNLDLLFPGIDIRSAWTFRVTRDADLDLQEDDAHDLLSAIESELRRRRFGEPVRLEVAKGMPQAMRDRLLEALELTPLDCYEVEGPLAISDFWTIANLDIAELHDAPFLPAIPRRLIGRPNIFSVIRAGDILLHHPYESFDPVVAFITQAARDPKVLAIKQTLYRTSGEASPVVAALIEAAEAGKQVAVMIELKARFDEENNIHWARRLERVGAHVVYSTPTLKTHAKIALVVREEADGLRRYLHFGTGNYNERSSRVYTDLSLFTCRPALGGDATRLFNALTGFATIGNYDELLVAPTDLRREMIALIDREGEHARAGRPNGIIAKMNALSDAEMVRAFYRAAQAGVSIELIVRGICVLRPGVPGVSETVRVRSIVGRFLEHSRIFSFQNGGDPEVYIGSADLMSRNLDRRVETVIPVLDTDLARLVNDDILAVLLSDNVRARILHANGRYERLHPVGEEAPVDAQEIFLRRAGGLSDVVGADPATKEFLGTAHSEFD